MNAPAEKIVYSNPRTYYLCHDWPSGAKRTTAVFYVEEKAGKGQRVVRQTKDKYGRWCAPKRVTYAPKYAIFDGSDGKTYLICRTNWEAFYVMQSNMQFQQEYVTEDSDSERFQALREMWDNVVDNRPEQLRPV